jgi:hypothetical protein
VNAFHVVRTTIVQSELFRCVLSCAGRQSSRFIVIGGPDDGRIRPAAADVFVDQIVFKLGTRITNRTDIGVDHRNLLGETSWV